MIAATAKARLWIQSSLAWLLSRRHGPMLHPGFGWQQEHKREAEHEHGGRTPQTGWQTAVLL